MRRVKAASLEQLRALPWLPDPVAAAVYEKLHGPAGSRSSPRMRNQAERYGSPSQITIGGMTRRAPPSRPPGRSSAAGPGIGAADEPDRRWPGTPGRPRAWS